MSLARSFAPEARPGGSVHRPTPASAPHRRRDVPPLQTWTGGAARRRALMSAVAASGIVAGLMSTGADPAAVAEAAGRDLVLLMRFLALVKAALALAAFSGVVWRLASPAAWPWLLAYAAAILAMAAGPGLIWTMAHVGWGAALLHGGLAACAVLLWRDPAVATRLASLLAARQARLGPTSP